MATFTTAANELKNASGSSWSSGRARQGVLSGTRYEGAIRFSGVSALDFGNIAISQIKLKLTFAAAGGDSTKYVTMYEGAQNTISGNISAMRGASIGAVSVPDAYSTTKTLTFNGTTHAAIFAKMRDHFMSGGQVLILYVPTTRGTYSGGYCYDYLSVTDAEITFTFEYLKSNGTLTSTSVNAGSAATLNITAYNPAYTHKVTWKFGNYSAVQNIAAGATSASYTIPLEWLNTIKSATSGQATVVLDTIGTSGASLGSNTYKFTITAPSSVVPTIGSVTASPVNSNSKIAGWGIYVQGNTKANLAIVGAAGAYGSSIVSYSITTSPSVGSATAASMQTGIISVAGTITVTGKVTDSRGRTATKTTTFSVYGYDAPSIAVNDIYRATSSGVRDDDSGTYARIRATFGCSNLGTGRNSATGQVKITQNGGSYTTTSAITSGTGITLGGGNLAIDATYTATFTITDTVGTVTTFAATISSAEYVLHVKKGGKAIGIGMAAGNDNTASFRWRLSINSPQNWDQIQIIDPAGNANYITAANGLLYIDSRHQDDSLNRTMLAINNPVTHPNLRNALEILRYKDGVSGAYNIAHGGNTRHSVVSVSIPTLAAGANASITVPFGFTFSSLPGVFVIPNSPQAGLRYSYGAHNITNTGFDLAVYNLTNASISAWSASIRFFAIGLL